MSRSRQEKTKCQFSFSRAVHDNRKKFNFQPQKPQNAVTENRADNLTRFDDNYFPKTQFEKRHMADRSQFPLRQSYFSFAVIKMLSANKKFRSPLDVLLNAPKNRREEYFLFRIIKMILRWTITSMNEIETGTHRPRTRQDPSKPSRRVKRRSGVLTAGWPRFCQNLGWASMLQGWAWMLWDCKWRIFWLFTKPCPHFPSKSTGHPVCFFFPQLLMISPLGFLVVWRQWVFS